jgi:YHS domain-containing protein
MKVDRKRAVRLERDGHVHFFCSEHCMHAYESKDAQPVH